MKDLWTKARELLPETATDDEIEAKMIDLRAEEINAAMEPRHE